MELRIKAKFKDKLVLFGGGGRRALGQRTQKELLDLAILALQSGDKSLIEVFEKLPTLAKLQDQRVQAALKAAAPIEEPKKAVDHEQEPKQKEDADGSVDQAPHHE